MGEKPTRGASRGVRRIALLNRGEAATRCLRAIRELRGEERSDLVGIALYTDPDRFAAFVREADEALSLGPALRRASNGEERAAYLDHDRVLAALRASRADAVWPGWGFLAEDPSFVEKVEAAGLVFLGPSADVMRRLGDKMSSKHIAEAADVPVAAWSRGPVDLEAAEKIANEIGFPVLLKATAGGGGRGIRRVASAEDLPRAFESATDEASKAFGDGTLFVEDCVENARHVEVQVAGDAHGDALALGLRDCSVQRRHQKVIEEGPPPGVPEGVMASMREASLRLIREVGYVGVATCEYLVPPDGRFVFLEVNPRLQVEHGVTEELTGFDLVKAQIRIARGERLPAGVEERGHAIEVRLCAENPGAGFVPSPGHVSLLELPAGPGIRVDSGISLHETIPSEFDSMLAKVIAHGATREEALARLERAVSDLRVVIEGGMTNKGFLLDVLSHSDFRKAQVDTAWLDRTGLADEPPATIEALVVAAILTYQEERERVRLNFFAEAARGRPQHIPASTGRELDLVYDGNAYRLRVFAIGGWAYRIHLGERVVQVTLLEVGPQVCQLHIGGERLGVLYSTTELELAIEIRGRLHRIQRDVGGKVRAPAPALLIELAVVPGDQVRSGQRLGLLEAMKTETAFFAPVDGVVREVLAQPGERVAAGDVIVVIEPAQAAGDPAHGPSRAIELPEEADPLDALFEEARDDAGLRGAGESAGATRAAASAALGSEARRILMGYDVNPPRAEQLVAILEGPVGEIAASFRAELAHLARCVELSADIEVLFSRAPTRIEGDELGPSNDARMAMYLRRMPAEGAGIDPGFLDQLRVTLGHYGIASLRPDAALERAALRLYATRTTGELRTRVLIGLLHFLMRLREAGETFGRYPDLANALDRLVLLRGTVSNPVADLAAQARFLLFEPPTKTESAPSTGPIADLDATLVPPPDDVALERRAAELDLTPDEARRIELWRFEHFELERIPSSDGIWALHGKARGNPGDERIFCFAEIGDVGPGAPSEPDLSLFERWFHGVIEAMRSIQGARDPTHRLRWNRLYLFVRPPIVLTGELVTEALRRLSPETGHLGLERVTVRLARVDPAKPDAAPEQIEVLASNPSGTRVEYGMRAPHSQPLATAGPYEQRVAAALARGLVYPYEVVRLFQSAGTEHPGPGSATGPGSFAEWDMVGDRFEQVDRSPGENRAGVVIGIISTPTVKHPPGDEMRRVLILGDPTRGMGALAAPECDRIVAAIDLAEREGLPVEWVAVSSGARIAMDSGTENLDATARVVRRLVTFTDAGGEVNVIVAGVNVGAQSYYDALATMGLGTRGVLIMLPSSSMVLTGRAALEISGGVSAEDEVGIGGYERIMEPSGQAHYQARDLAGAYAILLDHYACSYLAPGERSPRRFQTSDPAERDITEFAYDGKEDFSTIGDIFSAANRERKRPFSMRTLMRALVDQDAGWLERWRGWVGAETAIVWDTHLGGRPVALIGVESRPLPRLGHVPNDGPDAWTAGTLFPYSSKKLARGLNAASGVRPAVILANLSGFDGSPESMRRGVLEYGAEIARAVVRFRGPLLFAVVSRYHGGAYVVFSRELNDELRAAALSGSFASVIGGAAAAAVVFPREVARRATEDERVREARARVEAATDPAMRVALRAQLERVLREVRLEHQADVAAEFDAIHTVERAREVGSLEAIFEPPTLRPSLIRWLDES